MSHRQTWGPSKKMDLVRVTLPIPGEKKMIKKRYEVGTSSLFNNVLKKEEPIKLIVVAYDVAPQDWKPQVHPQTREFFPGRPETLGELKQRWGGKLQGTFSHLLSKDQEEFEFDISPWAHLPDDTYLKIEWKYEDFNPHPSCSIDRE